MNFFSIEHALNVIARSPGGSEAQLDAALYCLENGPPPLKAVMREGIKLCFGAAAYRPIEDTAAMLGQSVEEVLVRCGDVGIGLHEAGVVLK